ncbi:hypothetical protein D3C73_1672740 [compost metagenome]
MSSIAGFKAVNFQFGSVGAELIKASTNAIFFTTPSGVITSSAILSLYIPVRK